MRRARPLLALCLCALLALSGCGEPEPLPSPTDTPEPTPGPTAQPVARFSLGWDPAAPIHPITGEQLRFDSELPDYFTHFLATLRRKNT